MGGEGNIDMKKVAIISDTHLSSERLSGWVKKRIRRADHTIHAGDFDTRDGFKQIENLADDRLTAVRGNWDARDSSLPTTATVEIEETTFVITHGTTGRANNYTQRVVSVVNDQTSATGSVVGISGHTHRVLDTAVSSIRVLNPGSATGVYPAKAATMFFVEVDGAQLSVDLLCNGSVVTE